MMPLFDNAQRRPGREPRRHSQTWSGICSTRSAQRRPGREPRRHAARLTDAAVLETLNEGRGANPGDTCRAAVAGRRPGPAQRRPGREPRRHNPPLCSTGSPTAAQRRPGREPRRHGRLVAHACVCRVRSTKAGARTPATLPPPDEVVGAALRSTKAGARTPATPCEPVPRLLAMVRPAQRRPGREPRRHTLTIIVGPYGLTRSTKAGARTPATPPGSYGAARPGAGTAQRRPGREPRRHAAVPQSASRANRAQRRPGREPRRHPAFVTQLKTLPHPLNEGRGANPGDTYGAGIGIGSSPVRSTKAGARTPATHHTQLIIVFQ